MRLIQQILIDAGGGALLVFAGIISRQLRKINRQISEFRVDWYGQPARPGYPRQPGIPERVARLEQRIRPKTPHGVA